MSTKFKDFRGVDFPACLVELGFEDRLHHNDAAAFAVRDLSDAGVVVVVTCLARSRKGRVDQGDGVTEKTPRFWGAVCPRSGSGYNLEACRLEFECETEAELGRRVRALLAKFTTRRGRANASWKARAAR